MSTDLAGSPVLRPREPAGPGSSGSAGTATPSAPAGAHPYDVDVVRKDFPLLGRTVHDGKPLVYLDNAATSQKPVAVLDAEREYYERHNANVHRGIHVLAEEATAMFEGARTKVAAFIGAAAPEEVVFTKNASEAINLVAYAMGNAAASGPRAGRFRLGPGDEVVITEMEHHSNIVPWQLLCERTGATLKWFGLTDDGRLDLVDGVITDRTKIVSFVHQSNILGTVNPVADVVARAKAVGALVLLDGCQSVPHMGMNVGGPDVGGSASTSSPSPGTRCSGPPASACSGAAASCSPRCRPSSAAAR